MLSSAFKTLAAIFVVASLQSCFATPSQQPPTIVIQPEKLMNDNLSFDAVKDVVQEKIEFAKSEVFPALVTIYAFHEDYRGGRKIKTAGVGSGTIIDPAGYVISNAHVTKAAKKFICVLSNKEEVTATLVGEDYPTDLSVLKLDLTEVPDFNPVPTASFGNSRKMRIGDMVLAMGSPSGLTRTLTMGVISNTERNLGATTGEGTQRLGRYRTGQFTNWIQHDASINPGNSGGPLVNLDGEIIGINELKGRGDDIGYAIPSDIASQVYHELVRHGRVIRSYLGFNCATIKDTGEEKGILVLNVDESSPAAQAGLLAGDFILGYDGTPVTAKYQEDLAPFYRMASEVPIGKTVTLLIKRHGKQKKIHFTTSEQEDDWKNEKEFRRWGLTAADITPLVQKDLLLANRQGVYVTGVRSLAQKIVPSLQNRVITKVNETSINNLEDFNAIYKQYAEREGKYSVILHYTDGVGSYIGVLEETGEKPEPPYDSQRPWVGINTQVFTTDIRRGLGIRKKIQGVRVTQIFPNTLAEQSDLQVGDIVTHVTGQAVKAKKASQTQIFPALIQKHEVGQTIKFSVLRGEDLEKIKMDITLEEDPLEPKYAEKKFDNDFEFGVRNINFYDILNNRWPKETEGLIVTEVDSHGWASGKLFPNLLIVSINGQEIKTLDEFTDLMEKLKDEKQERIKFLLRYRKSTHVAFVEPEWEN